MEGSVEYGEYREQMVRRFWNYTGEAFGNPSEYIEKHPSDKRPPVFMKDAAWRNVLVRPGASQEEIAGVLSAILEKDRHRWFRSMTSSQALAATVFGNLKHYGITNLLEGLCCEQGIPIFAERDLSPLCFRMEYEVQYLGEPRPTSIDVLLDGTNPLVIECKLTEPEVGPCSRPRLAESDSAYEEQYCDGDYRVQRGRSERCPLTERGVLYWRLLPDLFNLDPARDYSPCPLRLGYQLIRNVLAAARHDGAQQGSARPCAILLYDERNPEFQAGGTAAKAFDEVSSFLKNKEMLRKCTWQMLIAHLRKKGIMPWLSEGLERKYGF